MYLDTHNNVLGIDFMDTAVFTTPADPTRTYSGLQGSPGVTFQTLSKYNNASVSFSASAVYYPDPAIVNQNFGTKDVFDVKVSV